MMRFICIAIIVACASCGNNSESKEANKMLSDSLFDAVMAGHDVAMPKMMKLERLQKEAKAAIDSIEKLSETAKKNIEGYKKGLDSLLSQLNYADFAMNKWMQEFKYDSLKNNEPERVKYLQNELEKVNKMKEAVLGSIEKADSLLKK